MSNRLKVACDTLKSLNPNLAFQPRSLIRAFIEVMDTEEMIDKIIMLEDKRLRAQRVSLKSLRGQRSSRPRT
jgi:hypothetical protein